LWRRPAPQVHSIGGAGGGSLDDPAFQWHAEIPSVDPGHSAAFTRDGEVIVFGWEPGVGFDARCQETSTDLERTQFLLRRRDRRRSLAARVRAVPGSRRELHLHNYNVVPLRNGNYVLVHGSYQSGTGVIDFTDVSNPSEIAWSDPAPLPLVPEFEIPRVVIPNPSCAGVGREIGGAWSSYWYNGFIYETNITEGLNVFRFSGSETSGPSGSAT
jgi:hypothetical protein